MFWIIIGLLVLIVILLGGGGILLGIVLAPIALVLVVYFWSDFWNALFPAIFWLIGAGVFVAATVWICMVLDRLWQKRKLEKQRLRREKEKQRLRDERLSLAEQIEENLYREEDGSFLVVTAAGSLRHYKTERGARKYLGLQLPPSQAHSSPRTEPGRRKPAAEESSSA